MCGKAAILFCEFDAAGFADDGDADLAGVLEVVFDAADDVAGELGGFVVGDFARLDEDAEFAARMDGEAFFDAGEGGAELFEVFDAFDVGSHGFAAGAGA
jgi:hypothetical protein